ncbi:MAG: hypothetical protein DWQ06_05600 [Calditrichaeota bacterium]|nr:MAG: hypothetical protein DWQ06_05600 [Calditrichota bacterium]
MNLKIRKRLSIIFSNSLNNLVLPISNVLVSFLVIHFASVELWGEFVFLMIFVNLASQFLSFGNKEFLLRKFSQNPSLIPETWKTVFLTRFSLVFLIIPFLSLSGFDLNISVLVFLFVFANFIHQSFNVLVIYERKFNFSVLVEIVSLVTILGFIYFQKDQLSLEFLVLIFTILTILKALAFTIFFWERVQSKLKFSFDYQILLMCLPFFALEVSGMLQSRTDLYCVAFFLTEAEVGKYQILINFLIYFQAFANFLLVPFAKNVYRLNFESIQKITKKLSFFGILVIPIFIFTLNIVLENFYNFEFDYEIFIFGGLFVLPVYVYLPKIYFLYKTNLQNKVLLVNVLGVVLNGILNFYFIPRKGLLGALISSAISQWIMLFAYYFYENKLMRNNEITLS